MPGCSTCGKFPCLSDTPDLVECPDWVDEMDMLGGGDEDDEDYYYLEAEMDKPRDTEAEERGTRSGSNHQDTKNTKGEDQETTTKSAKGEESGRVQR